MELWGRDIIELSGTQLRYVLKVDEHILYHSREKFSCVCLEINRYQPLEQRTSSFI